MIPAMLCVVLALVPQLHAAGATKTAPRQKPAPFVSLMGASAWKLTKAYRSIEPWKCTDSLFEPSDGWIATDAVWGDFVLEGEFLYNGKSQGGVLVRGDKEAWIPWLHGYEMDIDADMPGTGHIHFPFRPQPNPGVVQFPVDVWQHFSIRAAGQVISVKLDEKKSSSSATTTTATAPSAGRRKRADCDTGICASRGKTLQLPPARARPTPSFSTRPRRRA